MFLLLFLLLFVLLFLLLFLLHHVRRHLPMCTREPTWPFILGLGSFITHVSSFLVAPLFTFLSLFPFFPFCLLSLLHAASETEQYLCHSPPLSLSKRWFSVFPLCPTLSTFFLCISIYLYDFLCRLSSLLSPLSPLPFLQSFSLHLYHHGTPEREQPIRRGYHQAGQAQSGGSGRLRVHWQIGSTEQAGHRSTGECAKPFVSPSVSGFILFGFFAALQIETRPSVSKSIEKLTCPAITTQLMAWVFVNVFP